MLMTLPEMWDFLSLYLQYSFVQRAMIVTVLVALCSALLGVTLVLRRFSFIGDGLSHVAFGAMAVAAVLNLASELPLVLAVTVICAVLLLRTGQKWPACNTAVNAGLSVNCCRYLVEGCGAILVADDQASVEGFNADGSSSWPNHPQPVHHYLLIQNGVHILEFAQLDELAADKAYEFCFICLPSKVYPATGMFCRPIAIV